MLRLVVCLLLTATLLPAQDGLTPPWQLRKQIESLSDYFHRLLPIVDQIRPAEWRDAAPGYAEQQQTVRNQIESLSFVTDKVLKNPERLPVVLDLYFRFENFDLTLGSLLDGVRRYQNPAIADLVTGMRTDNAGVPQALKSYLVELANTREQEFQIADREAQRCRSVILKQPGRRQ